MVSLKCSCLESMLYVFHNKPNIKNYALPYDARTGRDFLLLIWANFNVYVWSIASKDMLGAYIRKRNCAHKVDRYINVYETTVYFLLSFANPSLQTDEQSWTQQMRKLTVQTHTTVNCFESCVKGSAQTFPCV